MERGRGPQRRPSATIRQPLHGAPCSGRAGAGLAALIACLVAPLALGCSPDEGGSSAAPSSPPLAGSAPAPAEALAERGRRVYVANCIACHNQDPAREGGLGPAVAGSSRALLEARVLRAEYPPGYEPKRDTRVMIALPHLEGELDALHAFLAQGDAGDGD